MQTYTQYCNNENVTYFKYIIVKYIIIYISQNIIKLFGMLVIDNHIKKTDIMNSQLRHVDTQHYDVIINIIISIKFNIYYLCFENKALDIQSANYF